MTRLANAIRIIIATMREIFDEAPYARFLQRTHTTSSRAAYAAFCRERDSRQERRPRCC
jgi:hypothetical protein